MSFDSDSDFFFDGLEDLHLVGSDQADSLSLQSISGCSTNSVDIVGHGSGQVVVEHQVDLRNIESSRGEIGSDQDFGRVAAEHGEVGDALAILHEGVQLGSGEG